MILLENVLISDEVISEEFVCNLNACKGACCVEGDVGAPLLDSEIPEIRRNLPSIIPYMSAAGRNLLEAQGFYEIDPVGQDLVTTCIEGRDCVFAIQDESTGIHKCAIELAYNAGESDFLKPISCHLYPIRIQPLSNGMEALNYDHWDICDPACVMGRRLQVPVYKFLEGPLTRKYGAEWVAALNEVVDATQGS